MTIRLHDTLTQPSIYRPVPARIASVRPLTAQEKLFTLELPEGLSLHHEPGQFVQLSLLGVGEAPISISSSPSRSNGTFEICVRHAGDLTGVLHTLEPGAFVGVRGPFGHGFPLKRFWGKDLLFLPAGLGLAPLRALINQVLDERGHFGRVTILYGARHPAALLFTDELAAWGARDDVELHVTVDRPDETWQGNVGVITTLIPRVEINPANTVAVTVGPPVVYRFVLMELLGRGMREGNVWLSLERRMRCGVGKCGHCQMNHLLTCREGPCFPYARIKHLEEAL